MHQLAHKVFWYAALILATTYAIRRGNRPERQFAWVMMVTSFATGVVMSFGHDPRLTGAAAVLGFGATICFAVIALRTDRWWPLWATAFQVISNTALVAPLIDPASRRLAGYVGSVGWDYVTLIALVVGTRFEGRVG